MGTTIAHGWKNGARPRILKAIGISVLGFALAWVVIIVLALRSCASSDLGQIGDEAIGVEVVNQCASSVRAKAGESAQEALARLNADAIVIESGAATNIALIANAAHEPARYFLSIRVGDEPPAVREFDLADLDHSRVTVTVTPLCTVQFPAGP